MSSGRVKSCAAFRAYVRGSGLESTTTRLHHVVRHVAEAARRGLIPRSARIVVAVSGGPDSVCLLAALDELRRTRRLPDLGLHIAHVNYGLRAAESDADEAFVRDL